MSIVSVISKAALLAAVAAIPVMAQGTGYLKTNVHPGRAGVFVDGKYLGPAQNFGVARKYAVTAGEHEVRLADPRYEDLVAKITVQPGKTIKMNQALKELPAPKPPYGRIRTISADKYAAVFVNGKYMGHAGEFNNGVQGLMLNPGTYTVKIVPSAGGAGHEEQVKLDADKEVIVRAK